MNFQARYVVPLTVWHIFRIDQVENNSIFGQDPHQRN